MLEARPDLQATGPRAAHFRCHFFVLFKVDFWKEFLAFFVDFRLILEQFWTLLATF